MSDMWSVSSGGVALAPRMPEICGVCWLLENCILCPLSFGQVTSVSPPLRAGSTRLDFRVGGDSAFGSGQRPLNIATRRWRLRRRVDGRGLRLGEE